MALEQLPFLPLGRSRAGAGECRLDEDFVSSTSGVIDPRRAGIPDSRPSQSARRTGHPQRLVIPARSKAWATRPANNGLTASQWRPPAPTANVTAPYKPLPYKPSVTECFTSPGNAVELMHGDEPADPTLHDPNAPVLIYQNRTSMGPQSLNTEEGEATGAGLAVLGEGASNVLGCLERSSFWKLKKMRSNTTARRRSVTYRMISHDCVLLARRTICFPKIGRQEGEFSESARVSLPLSSSSVPWPYL